MEKRAFFTETLAILALFMIATNAGAFNSGAHLYIAEKVFNSQNIDLYYGSVAPDIALYADQKQWPLSFENTHYNFIDLRSYAWGMTQKAFANGWLSHNEAWGADYYAHIENPLSNNSCATSGMYQGYVAEKACILAKQTGIDEELAHYAVETAVDLLLRN
ncbi:MAG: hypothetical protein QXK96_04265, partial [Candidatus Bathyarchaeia archaeon]